MVKAVFIDIDNTLLSFTEFVKKTMKDGFEEFGLPAYEESMFLVFDKVNSMLWHQIEQGELTLGELEKIRWNLIFEKLGIICDGPAFEVYFKKQMFNSAIEEPYSKEMLEYLSERYVLCAASNGPYEQQLNRLRIAGMYEYFSHYFISEKVGCDKPAKEFFEYCFREIREQTIKDLQHEETMIIGDSMTSDMAGGKNYGMKTCLYTRNSGKKRKIAGIDFVIDSLQEINEVL